MITVRLQGGMGNQMFQYACGRALAMRNNTSVQLDTTYLLDRTPRKHFTFREYDLDVFNVQAEVVSRKKYFWHIVLHRIKNKLLKPRGVERYFEFDPSVSSLGPTATLEGYWQSPRYFSEIQDTIRKDFTLKDPLSGPSRILLEEIKDTASVGMHVRRGDYVGNAYHDIGIDQSYYEEGLRYIANKQAVQKVYVFSDDIEWCREHLNLPSETVFVGPEYAGKKGEEHMMLMSACKHFVIPNSSFSWWAAWLSKNENKIVIVPKKWFNNDTINTNDLIPQGWVRL